jgi:predicted GH43/DUF377 family glycosyl hydrolase
VLYFDDFEEINMEYWLNDLGNLKNSTVLTPQLPFENRYIGGGCPPIKTAVGWLFIYHAVEECEGKRTYRAAAALLDLKDPTKILGRLPYPLFQPDETWEKNGDVSNVVFPTGTRLDGDRLQIYYGAADSRIASRSVSLSALLSALLPSTPKHSRHVHRRPAVSRVSR